MIVYLSNGTDPELFESYQKKGYIAGLLQAQKFNSIVIQGLSYWAEVLSVSNLFYKANLGELESTETHR